MYSFFDEDYIRGERIVYLTRIILATICIAYIKHCFKKKRKCVCSSESRYFGEKIGIICFVSIAVCFSGWTTIYFESSSIIRIIDKDVETYKMLKHCESKINAAESLYAKEEVANHVDKIAAKAFKNGTIKYEKVSDTEYTLTCECKTTKKQIDRVKRYVKRKAVPYPECKYDNGVNSFFFSDREEWDPAKYQAGKTTKKCKLPAKKKKINDGLQKNS
jgi:hypothetical protein